MMMTHCCARMSLCMPCNQACMRICPACFCCLMLRYANMTSEQGSVSDHTKLLAHWNTLNLCQVRSVLQWCNLVDALLVLAMCMLIAAAQEWASSNKVPMLHREVKPHAAINTATLYKTEEEASAAPTNILQVSALFASCSSICCNVRVCYTCVL